MKRKLYAFTLAEVLITLAIIGVVASLTIPSLQNSVNDMQYKTAYKKSFADISNALKLANSKGEIIPVTADNDALNNFKTMMKYFNIQKTCDSNNNDNCWDITGEGDGNPSTPAISSIGYIDNSGRSWSSRGNSTNTSCNRAKFYVDTNGLKGPNVFGKDRFPFYAVSSSSTLDCSGYIIKIRPADDALTANGHSGCNKGAPCYFTSWLIK